MHKPGKSVKVFNALPTVEEDFDFAIKLTDTRNWNLTREDFAFMTQLEPEGCFTLLEGEEKIGFVATITFDKIGWFGNLIVSESHRKEGAGAFLVKHLIKYMRDKKVSTIGCYAYMDTVAFYQKLGFQYESDFLVLEGEARGSRRVANVQEATKCDLEEIIKLDAACFGASRRKLLESIFANKANLWLVQKEDDLILGYVAAKVYDGFAEIGPLVCTKRSEATATNLMKTMLKRLEGHEVTLCFPKNQTALLTFLKDSGMKESFRVARMFLKPPTLNDCTYMAESLERG